MIEMTDNKKLSIIVPVYKVDAYIEKCIRSLEDQDLPKEEYEIIVINDGSPDRCREIVEELQKEFSNIILINQENQGVSMARNNGIAKAKGTYIMPVDADDVIEPNSIQHVINEAINQKLDVLFLSFCIFDINNHIVFQANYENEANKIYPGYEGYFKARGRYVMNPDRSWGILYKLDFLKNNKIYYPKNVPILEDALFLGKVFSLAKRISFSPVKLYKQYQRDDSAMSLKSRNKKKELDGYYNALRDLKTFEHENSHLGKFNLLLNHVRAKFLILLLQPLAGFQNIFEYKKAVKYLKDIGIHKIPLEGVRSPYYKLCSIYNQSPYLLPLHIHFKKFFR